MIFMVTIEMKNASFGPKNKSFLVDNFGDRVRGLVVKTPHHTMLGLNFIWSCKIFTLRKNELSKKSIGDDKILKFGTWNQVL